MRPRLLSFLADVLFSLAVRIEAMIPQPPPCHEDVCRLAETLAPQIQTGTVVVLKSGMVAGARVHAMSMIAVMHKAEREGDFDEAEGMAEAVIRLYTESKGMKA